MAQTKVVTALQEAGRRLREAIVDKIIAQGLLKTGALGRSIQDEVLVINEIPTLQIEMLEYGIFQDSGVKGRGNRNVVVADAESLFPPGQFKSKVIGGPLPFPVRKSIAERGLKPRPFIIPAVTQNQQYLEDSLQEAAGEDYTVAFNDLAKKYGAEVII